MILVTVIDYSHTPRPGLQYMIEDVVRQEFSFPTHPALSVPQLVDCKQDLIDDNMYPRLLRTTRESVGRARKGADL